MFHYQEIKIVPSVKMIRKNIKRKAKATFSLFIFDMRMALVLIRLYFVEETMQQI